MTLKEQFKQFTEQKIYERKNYNAEECEKIADDYAIDFAEWRLTTFLKNADQYTMKELLEIFKKERKL